MAVAAAWPLLAAAQPRVRVIATGGTIANHTAGRLSGPALVDSAPSVASIARVEAETFSNVSSIDLTLADWVRLSKRVNDVIAAGDVAGVVVTGGSDTLEELAWWLDLTVGGDRAVVVDRRHPAAVGRATPTARATWPMRCASPWTRPPASEGRWW